MIPVHLLLVLHEEGEPEYGQNKKMIEPFFISLNRRSAYLVSQLGISRNEAG